MKKFVSIIVCIGILLISVGCIGCTSHPDEKVSKWEIIDVSVAPIYKQYNNGNAEYLTVTVTAEVDCANTERTAYAEAIEQGIMFTLENSPKWHKEVTTRMRYLEDEFKAKCKENKDVIRNIIITIQPIELIEVPIHSRVGTANDTADLIYTGTIQVVDTKGINISQKLVRPVFIEMTKTMLAETFNDTEAFGIWKYELQANINNVLKENGVELIEMHFDRLYLVERDIIYPLEITDYRPFIDD